MPSIGTYFFIKIHSHPETKKKVLILRKKLKIFYPKAEGGNKVGIRGNLFSHNRCKSISLKALSCGKPGGIRLSPSAPIFPSFRLIPLDKTTSRVFHFENGQKTVGKEWEFLPTPC